jgi:hypothetical protein
VDQSEELSLEEHTEELSPEEALMLVSVHTEVALLTLALVGMVACTGESLRDLI